MASTGTNVRTRAKGGIVLPAPKIRITGGAAADVEAFVHKDDTPAGPVKKTTRKKAPA